MKYKFKKLHIYIIIILVFLACFIRIYYLNFIRYPQPIYCEYTSDDIIEHDGFKFNLSGYHIYTKEELINKYGEDIADIADANDVFLNLTLQNNSSEPKYMEIGLLSLQIDNLTSTSPNPYLIQYFNNENKTTGYYEPNEESTITLVYPIEDLNSDLGMVFSLYPDYILVNLKPLGY